jgi:hypothetical protein
MKQPNIIMNGISPWAAAAKHIFTDNTSAMHLHKKLRCFCI